MQVAQGASGYAVSGVATRGHVERGKRPKCLKRAVRAPCINRAANPSARYDQSSYAVVEILRRFPIRSVRVCPSVYLRACAAWGYVGK